MVIISVSPTHSKEKSAPPSVIRLITWKFQHILMTVWPHNLFVDILIAFCAEEKSYLTKIRLRINLYGSRVIFDLVPYFGYSSVKVIYNILHKMKYEKLTQMILWWENQHTWAIGSSQEFGSTTSVTPKALAVVKTQMTTINKSRE